RLRSWTRGVHQAGRVRLGDGTPVGSDVSETNSTGITSNAPGGAIAGNLNRGGSPQHTVSGPTAQTRRRPVHADFMVPAATDFDHGPEAFTTPACLAVRRGRRLVQSAARPGMPAKRPTALGTQSRATS